MIYRPVVDSRDSESSSNAERGTEEVRVGGFGVLGRSLCEGKAGVRESTPRNGTPPHRH